MSRDFKAVLLLVWAGATLATATTVAAPFVLSEGTIARIAPRCEWKRLEGRACILCGTTTAFVAIGHRDWRAAARANRLAIPMFAAFSLNAVAAVAGLALRSKPGGGR